MKNTRYALPDSVRGADIKTVRESLKLTQRRFADLVGVSVKTVERWESSSDEIRGPIIFLLKLLWENPDLPEAFEVPEKPWKLRIWYMFRDEVCTIIDLDEKNRRVKIKNYTDRLQYRAFGINEHPTYEDVEEFLESRCFPRERDKQKLILDALDIPFYDPMMIIERTKGRMAEDDFWLKLDR